MQNDQKTLEFLGNLEQSHQVPGLDAQSAANPYTAGEITRLNRHWQPLGYSPDDAIGEDWELATRRILDSKRNDPSFKAINRALCDNIIGTGLMTTAAAQIGDELDDEFNTESDEAFEWWAENEADVYGRLAWYDMQRQLLSEMNDCGECLLLSCTSDDKNRTLPLCFQVLEAEQIDSSKDQPAGEHGNEIKRGIELDSAGRPVAYWLFDAHPDDSHASMFGVSKRIPAERVIHLIEASARPSQTRGIGIYTSIMQSARDLDNYLGSELTAALIGSLFTVVHKTASPGSGMGFVGDGSDDNPAEDEYGNPRIKLGRGIVSQIGPNDEISQVEATRPNSEASVFTNLILMLLGMGSGVSRYRITRDYSGTTYVAARAAHLDDKASFRPLQGYVGRGLCLPVRRLWTAQAVGYGLLRSVTARQFDVARSRWLRMELFPAGWDQIDPEKETDAAIAGIAAGISTLKEVNAAKGKNWRSVLKQRSREIKYAEKLGLDLSYERPSTPARGPKETTRETTKET